jgi:hypothetical protein
MAHFVGIYWGPREESRTACALRMSAFLHALAKQDAAFALWFKKASSRKAPLVSLPNDADELSVLVKTNQRDVGSGAIVELGFSYSAWTGPSSRMTASLSATFGGLSPAVRNSVVLSFDPEASPAPDLLQSILPAAVAEFDPEDGGVSSTESLSAHPSLLAWQAPAVARYKAGSGFSAA